MSDEPDRRTVHELQRHPSLDERFDPAVRIVDHDPRWREMARDELARIATAVGPFAVGLEHVGSTAVPGLAAKPIVDLQVAVNAVEERGRYVSALERLGYLFVFAPESPDYHLFAKPPQRPRLFHVHVCQVGSAQEFRHLVVRDYLRAHPKEAASYEALKRALVARHPQDRIEYVAGKDGFVQALERCATTWARDRGGHAGRD
jgi:GrpB-like predicted nucleotidyltransferase (UPF0157 family)